MCDDLIVEHWFGEQFAAAVGRMLGDELVARLRAGYPPVEHPLVVVHPVTGRRALFLGGSFMSRVIGLHPKESDLLLGYLHRLLDDPNRQVRWHWQADDLAIWDERCTNHRALSDHYPMERTMRRCTVDGPLYVEGASASSG